MYSIISTTSKQVLVWAIMFTLVLSVFPTVIADEDDEEWFWDIGGDVTDEDGDGSDDTIDIGYDPDTTCDCNINITVYVDIYDENGYLGYIYDYHTIYDEEGDWFSQDWTPDNSGTFDFYVSLYDEWDNFEDSWNMTGVELEPMSGSSDETINVDNRVGDFHGDGINNDMGMFAFIKGDPVEGVEVNVEYFNGVIWTFYTNGTTDDYGEFVVENATNGEYRWIAEYDDEDLEEETLSYTEVDTAMNLSHMFAVDDWDDAGDYDDFLGLILEGDDSKDDGYVEVYDDAGDLYDSGTTNAEFWGYNVYLLHDVEKGNYTFNMYYEENGELLQSGWLHSYGSTSTNYDEWFDDWDYETEDTNGDGEANSITTSYDPDTECNCTVEIEVEMSVYNNDTGDWVDYDDYYYEINGTQDDWFETDDWSPGRNANYTFEFYLYDENWNYEDHFNFTVYLECDDDSNNSDGCDNDEWFEDWDSDSVDTDDDNLYDTLDISYNPDTDCDCEVEIEVEVYVYENSTGDWVDSMYDYHTINGTEEEYFEQSWTSHESQSYDFYVYMYDDDWNSEDEFWIYNVYLYQKSGGGGPGDDDEYFDWIYEYVWDDDDDGYNDTVEIEYDPDTTCECDINITLYIDIYDNQTGTWVNGTEEGYTIYHDDNDYWYQDWSPEYNGTFDFYVEMYDEDDNLEDEVEYLGVELHARSSGGDGDNDEWFYDWDYDVNPSDTITIGYDPDTECDCYVNITVYIDVYESDTGDWIDWTYDDHTIYNGEGDWFEQDWTASNDGNYDFYVEMYDDDGNDEDDFWIYNVSLESDGGGGNGSDNDEWFDYWDYDVDPSDTINIGYDPDTECDCDVDIEVYVDVFENQTGDYIDSLYDEHTIYNGYGDWFTQDWTAYYNGTYDFRVELYDPEYGHEEDSFWIYDVYLSSDGGGGGGDDNGIGHLSEIMDWDDDAYVNDYVGAVTEDGDWRYEAYFEIYDDNGNFVDAGTSESNGIFVSENLDEGTYSHYIYYDEGAEDSIHYGIFYSYGESSGQNSSIINVDMAVMEDDNEDGYPNIFCGGGPCDDALFQAHEGNWDNGISDVVIDIYEYDSGTGETEYYDTVYTNDTGDAISYDHPCGEYVWNATYYDDEIDKGYYQVWAGCDGTGGGGDEDYDEWFYSWDYDVNPSDTIHIGYDPDTDCECYVDIEVYIDIFDNQTGDYVGSLYDEHTIYHGQGDSFEQDWTADYEGSYDFRVELYDPEYGHEEDSFWIYDVYLGSDGGGGGHENGVGHFGFIDDVEEDGYVNDYIGAVLEGDYYKEDSYFEIYDEEGNLVDSGNPNYYEVIFVSHNLTEGWYYQHVYYEENGAILQEGPFYSYGNSSNPETSDIVNVDNLVVDDDEYYVYDDVAFMAHRGNLSDETGEEGVEIWVYVWNEEEEAWYDHAHLVTDENGEAWLHNETCGQYQWESSVDDGGHYEVWVGCDDGGGGTENYDEWIYSWIHYVPQDENGNNNWNEIVVGYDPDTDCDCDVEIYVVLEVYDENGNLAADSSSSHTINGDQQDWFLQEISMNIEPGNYDFILNMYDEHGNHEEEKSFSLIMSDEWLDYDWTVEEDSNVKIDLQGNTNYDGEIHTYYEANVYRWNENDNDWEKIDELAENATISSGDENSASIHFEWEAEESGDYRFVVYMYDGMGQEDSFEFETNLVLNSAPEIGDLNTDRQFEGQMFDFKVDAWDEDGDDLKFTWDMGDGEKREGESVRYGYPDDGIYTIEVSVSDGETTTVKEFEVKVENLDPELTVSFTDEADEGSELSFAAQVDDVSMDDVTVTWTFADGSKFDGIFVQYDFNDDGEYLITVVAEDEDGGRTEEQILVTIKNVDPIFTEFVMPSSAEEGEALNFMVTATDPGDDTITYTFNFGDGTAVMMSEDGNISHKFAEGDTFDVIICAKDEDGGETCRTETIPVSVLEQLEEEGLLPGFGVVGALSALGVIGMLRRRTH